MNRPIDRIHDDWQKLCPRTGLVMPWYTHGALEELLSMDFRGKRVFEWGAGCSTFWWSRVAEHVHAIDAHQEWVDWIVATACSRGFTNITVERRWPEPTPDEYKRVPEGRFDVVCVDGAARTACIIEALKLPRPFILIVDNWQQPGVYTCAETAAMLEPYRSVGSFHVQPEHRDGWCTAIWRLP